LVRFFEKLQKLEKSPMKGLLANLRTHPLTENRIARAKKLMRRAHDYGRRSIEAAHKGFWADFGKDRQKALGRLDDEEDVPRLYWTAISLAALITQSKDDMGLVGELPVVEALMGRAYALRPDWDDGAIHEFYISYDGGRSEAMGGSVKKAKEHFDRVMQLTGGKKVGPLVTWAEVVAVEAQNRKEFNELLDKALAFDVDEAPRFRLVNVLAQQKARRLKARADDLFLEE
ncbi:MAG: TRAP transporter TatT component family protein, partial [Myxococcales bacterium]